VPVLATRQIRAVAALSAGAVAVGAVEVKQALAGRNVILRAGIF